MICEEADWSVKRREHYGSRESQSVALALQLWCHSTLPFEQPRHRVSDEHTLTFPLVNA